MFVTNYRRYSQQLWNALLVMSLLTALFLPPVVQAQEPINISPELHQRVLNLNRQFEQTAPYVQQLPQSNNQGSLKPANQDLNGVLLLSTDEPRSEVAFSPPPLFPEPTLPSISPEMLRQLDIPPVDSQSIRVADLDDPFNPINRTASYGVISGHTAQDFGFNLTTGRGANGRGLTRFCYDCSASYYYADFTGSKNSKTPNELLLRKARKYLADYKLKTARNGGNGNQFNGQLRPPGGWNVNSRNPFFAGASSTQSNTPTTLRALLGYDRYQNYAYQRLFQQVINQLYAPWRRLAANLGIITRQANRSQANSQQVENLETRYLALADQQLDLYFQDNGLSDLRRESHRLYLFYMYYDPYYLYLDYTLNAYLQSIYTSRPHYTNLYNQAQLVGSRTSPPSDNQTLRQHYYDRLLLQYYV